MSSTIVPNPPTFVTASSGGSTNFIIFTFMTHYNKLRFIFCSILNLHGCKSIFFSKKIKFNYKSYLSQFIFL